MNASRSWVCVACAERRVEANIRQLRAKRGPYARKWRAGLQRWAMGLQVTDEDTDEPQAPGGTAAAG